MNDNNDLVSKFQRIRHVKPEFFQHEGLYEAEEKSGLPVRLALAGLWTCCDKHGRFEWKPRSLKLKILPYDQVDFATVLEALAAGDFIRKYSVDGKDYGYIPTWRKHQHIGKSEMDTKWCYPAPNGKETVGEPLDNGSSGLRNGNVSEGMERKVKERNVNGSSIPHSQSLVEHSSLQSANHSPQAKPAREDNDELPPYSGPLSKTKFTDKPRNPDEQLAHSLASLLYSVLPADNQGAAPIPWRRMWAEDFHELLKREPYQEIEAAIKMLPRLKIAKIIVRAKTFCEKYDEIREDMKKVDKKSGPTPWRVRDGGKVWCAGEPEDFLKPGEYIDPKTGQVLKT